MGNAVEMDSASKTATTRFVVVATSITAAALALVVEVFYLHPGPLSIYQTIFATSLVAMSIWAQFWLRTDHVYYQKMAQNGCGPLPKYRGNTLGIPYLKDAAEAIKANRLLQRLAEQIQEHSHTFATKQFPVTAQVIISDDPENTKTVLSTRFEDWDIPKTRIRAFLPVLGYHSIFSTNGPEWQHSRAMLRPAFVRDQISDIKCFDKHISKLIQRLPKDGSHCDLQEMLAKLTIDSTSDFMLGQSTDLLGEGAGGGAKFGDYFEASLRKIGLRARLGWVTQILPDPELNTYTRFIRSYVDDFVVRKRQSMSADMNGSSRKYVFLDELLKTGEPAEVIRNQLLSIFLAGRDTTTSVLTYLFLELSRRPDVVTKIQEEIRDLGVADPSWEQLKNMKYLNWTVKEALRLNPPVPTNAREAVRDTILPVGGGPDGKQPVFVPKGSLFRYLPWVMHRREDLFGSDAKEFNPGRWEHSRPSFEYVPFNAGPRICIGQQFALTQMAMVTYRMLQTFKTIERVDDRQPILKVAINVALVHGCWVRLTPA